MISDELKAKLVSLPDAPGVYKMLNAKGTIIYIGKSKCLKKRVKSYFVPSPKWEKAVKMQPFIHDICYEVTDTHLDAMLLECRLIKEIQPYFNVLMKWDKKYAYIKPSKIPSKPPLALSLERSRDCFGPFPNPARLKEALNAFQNFYPIQKEGRCYQFEYHILPRQMDDTSYQQNYTVLLELLTKPAAFSRFCKQVEKQMQDAANDFRFETASMYRDALPHLKLIQKGLSSWLDWNKHCYLLDLETGNGRKLYLVAYGKLLHSQIYPESTPQIRSAFIRAAGGCPQKPPQSDDHSDYDFRKILYSEIHSLPEEQVELLK